MTGKIRILIADDHAVVRAGLKTFFMSSAEIEVIGEAGDGLEAVNQALSLKPDLVLMDLLMPGLDGIQATARICQQDPSIRILIITSFSEDERVVSAIQAGALGYLLKDTSPQELEQAIRVVHGGESYLPPNIARKVIRQMNKPPSGGAAGKKPTPRELEILKLVAEGHSNDEIARLLYLSVQTVSSHLWRVMKKLEVDNRTQLALYAVHNGLVKNS
jgi:NarL family two-component system response regulator LiaR